GEQFKHARGGGLGLGNLAVQADQVLDRGVHHQQRDNKGEKIDRGGTAGQVEKHAGDADRTHEFYQRSGRFGGPDHAHEVAAKDIEIGLELFNDQIFQI